VQVQKQNYRYEKRRATNELLNVLKDPSIVIIADWLKVRGSLRSWTKLWCVLKPGILLLYKSNKAKVWMYGSNSLTQRHGFRFKIDLIHCWGRFSNSKQYTCLAAVIPRLAVEWVLDLSKISIRASLSPVIRILEATRWVLIWFCQVLVVLVCLLLIYHSQAVSGRDHFKNNMSVFVVSLQTAFLPHSLSACKHDILYGSYATLSLSHSWTVSEQMKKLEQRLPLSCSTLCF